MNFVRLNSLSLKHKRLHFQVAKMEGLKNVILWPGKNSILFLVKNFLNSKEFAFFGPEKIQRSCRSQ